MPDETWIKVYRKLKDNPISSNLELLWFLTYLMLDVNHKDNSFYIWEKRIDLKAGQKLTSQRKLAEQFNISLSKVNRFLKILSKEKILKHEWNTKFTIVTLLNWDRYNGSETLIEHEKKARGKLEETNKNVNNNNNEKNNIIVSKDTKELAPIDNRKTEINTLIEELKQQADILWIAYDKKNERNFWKHIMTAKEFGDFCEKIWQDRIEFAKNIMIASERIKYWKGTCSWPMSIYQNYSEVYNLTKTKSEYKKPTEWVVIYTDEI